MNEILTKAVTVLSVGSHVLSRRQREPVWPTIPGGQGSSQVPLAARWGGEGKLRALGLPWGMKAVGTRRGQYRSARQTPLPRCHLPTRRVKVPAPQFYCGFLWEENHHLIEREWPGALYNLHTVYKRLHQMANGCPESVLGELQLPGPWDPHRGGGLGPRRGEGAGSSL